MQKNIECGNLEPSQWRKSLLKTMTSGTSAPESGLP
jgi:hypothetical protein